MGEAKQGRVANRTSPHQLKDRLRASLERAADRVLERFLESMPDFYFEETDPDTQLAHLTALVASEASGLSQQLTLTSDNGGTWTFLHETSYPGQLGEMVRRLPRDRPLSSATVHTSLDGKLVLDVFELGQRALVSPDSPHLGALVERAPESERAAFRDHLLGCTEHYVSTTTGERGLAHYRLVARVRRSGNAELEVEAKEGGYALRLCLEGGGARLLFERVSHYLGRKSLDIQRAHVATFEFRGRSQRLISFLAAPVGDGRWSEEISSDLRRLPYLDRATLELWEQSGDWTLVEAEVITALIRLAHQKLSPRNPLAFSRSRVVEMVIRNASLARSIARAFQDKFRPGSEEYTPPDLSAWIRKQVDRDDDRKVLTTLLEAVHQSLRTNLYLEQRQSLAIRLAPDLLSQPGEPLPFGVFFVHGRDFDGFHVRFQDVARGGLRLVCPRGSEQYALESERLYDEALGLAQAQQLKNKDIPEGGAKAVVLVTPSARATRCAQSFADALLDLTSPDPAVTERLVDYYGAPELLYLGPDENVSDELIEWVVERARHRFYSLPAAFMSSKPGAGINHKAYGITSEGVTVFLDVALRRLGIDPKQQPFTVKLTGGPDGDVGGNEIKILLRDYPETVKIVGIADGSGCAEDPQGLKAEELMRLVTISQPIASFDPSQLSPEGRLFSLDQPEGLRRRNTLHNRLKADAFIPAGGRPRTIHSENWREFLDHQGRPTSPLIVEGANLFLTDTARRRLGEHGVSIVKDSSANKCGVICSSFEILASMMLTEDEFLERKERFVGEVIERLRGLARAEAELLFREREHRPDSDLPELSIRLSGAILEATEAVAEAQLGKGTDALLRRYLPATLLEFAETRLEQVPASYRQRIVACSLASRIVYREGLTYLESMPRPAIAELAARYLEQELRVEKLVAQVMASELPEREAVAELLREGGPRAGLRR